MTRGDLHALLAAFEASDWDEMTLTLDGERVRLSKTAPPAQDAAGRVDAPSGPSPSTPPLSPVGHARLPQRVAAGAIGSPAEVAPVPAVEAAEQQLEALLEASTHVHRVVAPSVGVFWRAPEPAAPPFVEVGQRVEPAAPVCIVEVMKLFNHVQAGVSGTVRSVEVANGAMVEHGQTLFVVELDG